MGSSFIFIGTGCTFLTGFQNKCQYHYMVQLSLSPVLTHAIVISVHIYGTDIPFLDLPWSSCFIITCSVKYLVTIYKLECSLHSNITLSITVSTSQSHYTEEQNSQRWHTFLTLNMGTVDSARFAKEYL